MTTPKRGAVIIAVKKTGQLPELQTVHKCAEQMSIWARKQGFPKKLVKVITDEKKPVHGQQIRDAVAKLVKEDGIEQIVVYFAGHGVVNGGEMWLLSGAPEDGSDAVNLEGSILLARFAGIPHVVFISDACRTAVEGIQGTRVKGQDIFPNFVPSGEQPVDVFFACGLGSPSNEIKDPKNSAKVYKSVYTEALLVGLQGKKTDLIEELEDGDDIVGLVRPKPLGDYLVTELKERLKGVMTDEGPLNQVPFARLNSQGERWMARFSEPRASRATRGGKIRLRPAPSFEPVVDANGIAERAVRSVLSDNMHDATKEIATALANDVSGVSLIEESIKRTQTPFGPAHFETNCGFKVRGNRIVGAEVAGGLNYTLFTDTGEALRLDAPPAQAASVLLKFKSGVGLVMPAIPGFIAAIEFDGSELVSVNYEPSDRSHRWLSYKNRLKEFRALRGLITASARLGTLTFKGSDASELARQMQMTKNADPYMAVYAAYAYHQLGLSTWMREMYEYQLNDLGFRFFDIALLTRELYRKHVREEADVYPGFPMLSQGWTLLSAYQVKLLKDLIELRDHLVPSIWTLLDKSGIDIAARAINSGILR
jgi:hypothetical protein